MNEPDTRTCDVCGEPISPSLHGFMDSIRACGTHLLAWTTSDARKDAVLASVMSGRPIGLEPFQRWADEQRAVQSGDKA